MVDVKKFSQMTFGGDAPSRVPGRFLNNWMETYLEYTKHSEAPRSFHYWCGVSAVAAVLRRRVWLDMGHFKWFPNHFIFLVAPPGVATKGTSLNIAYELVKQVGGINLGPNASTWQHMVTYMSKCTMDITLDGKIITVSEASLAISEAGTFFDPSDRNAIDFLTDMWDCRMGKEGSWSKGTKGEGIEQIENPYLNLIACTTPSWVAENCSDYFIGGGFTSRTIFVHAQEKRKLVAYPKLEFSKDMNDIRDALVHDLQEIGDLQGEVMLSSAGVEWGEKWYKTNYDRLLAEANGNASEMFVNFLARKQAHIHKLAIILAACEGNGMIITAQHLKDAEEQVTLLEKDLPRIFAQKAREDHARHTGVVYEKIQDFGGTVEKNTLFRSLMRLLTFETFESSLKALSNSDLIVQTQKDHQVRISTTARRRGEA